MWGSRRPCGQPASLFVTVRIEVRGEVQDARVCPDIGNVVVREAVGNLERLFKRTHPQGDGAAAVTSRMFWA